MNTSTPERILLVDDDQALLDATRRTLRKAYDLHTACGGKEGLEVLSHEGSFAVVISDYQMPGMNGVTFLGKVRETVPDTVRVMLTGNADLSSAIEAVNTGHIFRFLTKPCAPEVLTSCLEAALEQYRLRQAEKILLEQTVRGSIEVLAGVLALSNPDAFGRSIRVQGYVRHIVQRLQLSQAWQFETAALLSQIGFVAIPPDIIDKLVAGEALSSEYEQVFERHPAIAKDLLAKIPRLEAVTEMIANQRMRHSEAKGSNLDQRISLGSQILSVALAFDELVSLGASRSEAIRALKTREGFYDPRLLKVLVDVELPGQGAQVRSLAVKDLRVGMVLDQDVRSDTGAMVVTKGNKITQGMLARLRNYAELRGISEPIRVRVSKVAAGGSTARVA